MTKWHWLLLIKAIPSFNPGKKGLVVVGFFLCKIYSWCLSHIWDKTSDSPQNTSPSTSSASPSEDARLAGWAEAALRMLLPADPLLLGVDSHLQSICHHSQHLHPWSCCSLVYHQALPRKQRGCCDILPLRILAIRKLFIGPHCTCQGQHTTQL